MAKGNKLLAMSLAATLATGSALTSVAHADQLSDVVFDEAQPRGGSIVVDALIARPILTASTVVGSALFIASLPFSLPGGTVANTWDTLVLTPSEQAFIRCLGCTPTQHERIRAERKTAQLAEDAARSEAEKTEAAAPVN